MGGTFATAPLAFGVPQSWVLAGAANTSGMTVVIEKGRVEPNGKPMVKITIGGSLGTGLTATLNFRQQITSATLNALIAGGFFSVNDKLRGRANVRADAGSQKLIGVGTSISYTDAAAGQEPRSGRHDGVGSRVRNRAQQCR
ncbi:hypothetical protein KCP91_15245 [Microvirga sp. SRT01]|nr:hypothetical protein [Microvirga sp. SRT01]MBR7710779.1 hypothetical protein [Microvirga sp. SRT01]